MNHLVSLVWLPGHGGTEVPESDVFHAHAARGMRRHANPFGQFINEELFRIKFELNSILGVDGGPCVLVVTLDASSSPTWADDVRETLEQVVSPGASARGYRTFTSRPSGLAVGYLVPPSRLPTSVQTFIKFHDDVIDSDVREKVEKDLREAIEANFQLPKLGRDALLDEAAKIESGEETVTFPAPSLADRRAALLALLKESFESDPSHAYDLLRAVNELAPPDAQDRFLKDQLATLRTTNQAADELGLTPDGVKKVAQKGELGTMLGRDYHFTRQELAAHKEKDRRPGPRPKDIISL